MVVPDRPHQRHPGAGWKCKCLATPDLLTQNPSCFFFSFNIFFLMWTICKVLIEFVTIASVVSCPGMKDLSSLTRDCTLIPRLGN